MHKLRHSIPGGLEVFGYDFGLFQLRFHWWKKAECSDIHNETRPFISLVIRGELLESRWSIRDGTAYAKHLCIAGGKGGGVDGYADAVLISSYTRRALSCYTLPSKAWHKIEAKSGTMTISIRGPMSQPTAHFLRERSDA